MVYQKIKNLDVHFNFLIKIMEKKVPCENANQPREAIMPGK